MNVDLKAMTTSKELPPTFSPCQHCCTLQENTHTYQCPALDVTRLTDEILERLLWQTPFAEWQTPEEISLEFDYSYKHVIRLIRNREHGIAAFQVDKRWKILRCSFAHYLDRCR